MIKRKFLYRAYQRWHDSADSIDLKRGSHLQLTNPLRNEVHNVTLALHHTLNHQQRCLADGLRIFLIDLRAEYRIDNASDILNS